MNILPKKRWHVRTKENIARVRKDEAEAAEKEKQERLRIENAEREARLSILKQKSKQNLLNSGIEITQQTPTVSQEHINLFTDLEHANTTTNKDHDKEAKEKKEDYEKKIGYLTYLGQDTNEALKKKNWYEVLPETSRFSRSNNIRETYDKLVLKDEDGKQKMKDIDIKDGEVSWKAKQRLDPINSFKKYCETKPQTSKVKSNAETSVSTVSNDNHTSKNGKKEKGKDCKMQKLLKLREARLKREQQEKHKTELFLTGLNKPVTNVNVEKPDNKIKPKYNSQFNPELARQNYR